MSKEAYRIVVRSVRFSGEGERNIGICAEPSLVSDNEREFFALHCGMSGADNDDFIDVVLSEATGTVRTY
jgi:hypothetical protein